jgi:hypothetical protein
VETAAFGAEGGPHSLADALEVVAKKIRAGEISSSGYEEGMGDAAALAAALAAVLGLRR